MRSGSSTALRITLFVAACLFPALAFGQNDNWLGGAGNWSNGSMWSLGAPPSGGNNALIDNGNPKASAVTLDTAGQCSDLTIDSDDGLSFNNGQSLTIDGSSIGNSGAISLNSTGSSTVLYVGSNVSLTGGGTVTMSNNPNNAIFGTAAGLTLTNVSNTIQGAGSIGTGQLILGNQKSGVIDANQSNPFIITTAGTTNTGTMEATAGGTLVLNGNGSGTITNNGILKVAPGSTLHVTNGTFTNFSGGTLTGGTYNTAGTLEIDELGTGGGEIVTNSAKIILTGATAVIVDQSNTNALTNFASNTKKGSFSLMSKSSLTTSGSVTNAGKLTVGAKSNFKTGSGSYTQTSGATTVDGTLTAPTGVDIQAGSLFGKGVISATVTSSGTVTAGDTTKKAGKLSMSTYTQNSGGSLDIQIGGTTLGTQYSQVAVANGVSLNGTLNINLINNFIPAIGNQFTILTGSAITGQFSTVNLPPLSGAHFVINYNATTVTLTVVSG